MDRGETDLHVLLNGMEPILQPGTFVFCTLRPGRPVGDIPAWGLFREAEGTTLILERETADRIGLPYSFIANRITLTVHSSLAAVGLLAAVSARLAAAGISCNVVSAFYHDHLFVPADAGPRALAVLKGLQESSDPVPTLLDRQAVIDTLLRLGRAFDERDWPGIRACLADEVDTDYSSFRGTPPARLTPDELIQLRRQAFVGLQTQHLSLDHRVEITADRATCRCDFIIHRWPIESSDRRFFHSYGYYLYGLIRGGSSWRVTSITQVVLRSDGDSSLHGAHRA